MTGVVREGLWQLPKVLGRVQQHVNNMGANNRKYEWRFIIFTPSASAEQWADDFQWMWRTKGAILLKGSIFYIFKLCSCPLWTSVFLGCASGCHTSLLQSSNNRNLFVSVLLADVWLIWSALRIMGRYFDLFKVNLIGPLLSFYYSTELCHKLFMKGVYSRLFFCGRNIFQQSPSCQETLRGRLTQSKEERRDIMSLILNNEQFFRHIVTLKSSCCYNKKK